MTEKEIIQRTENFVKNKLKKAEGGHDWWHIYRVRNNAMKIAATESGDKLIVELGALLHDIADSKFHDGDESIGPRRAGEFLQSLGVDWQDINHIKKIIQHISFKGGNFDREFYSDELAILQDADRLDALGAIGIARAFNYGGFKGRALYDPDIAPELNMSVDQYKKSTAPTINHFYEKLLLLKDRMNTATGKKMAQERHDFILTYLEQFYREWE
ncbi:MAG: HD domain-containing protein [Saprospiraceae bacterium]|nr:HD domain-containing protein [Saprospiraceae bacterium]